MLAWKCLYPIGIHFAISQVLSYLGMYLLVWRTGADITAYYQQALLLTGLTGILASVPCIWLYRGDYRRRSLTGILGRLGKELTPASISDGRIQDFGAGSGKNVSCSSLIGGHLHIPEMIMFLVIGAFLGQYGNILVGLFQQYLNPEVYQETQSLISDGKSIWSLIFWMGIIAPLAEEIIFRWLVFLRMRDNMRVVTAALLSGLCFGIYHMNLLQGVYATILGTLFALLLEWSGKLFTSVLLHMGANIWSLIVSDVMLYMLDHTGTMSVMVLNVFLVLAGVILIRVLTKLVGRMLERSKALASLRVYILSVFRIGLWFLLVLIAAESVGIPTGSIIALLSVAGLAVSLALQNTLSNVAGGITLLVTKPFQVGDYVEADGVSGTVKAVDLSYTTFTTIDNKEIFIPNSQLSSVKIVNYTASGKRRVDLNFSASYDAPTQTVKDAIREVVDSIPQIIRDPEPVIWLSAYESSSIQYVVRAWTTTEDYWDVYYTLLEGVRDSFARHGVEMTYDHLNVHLMKEE